MLTKLLCEFGATALMIIFGVGVHCDTVLKGTKYCLLYTSPSPRDA